MTDKAGSPYPYLGVNGDYYDKEFLKSVEHDLLSKVPVWASGLAEPTPCERFAYYVLKQIKMNRSWNDKG
ncbi:MAG: hypothetical protein KJZ83_00170 [Burkholderiaceae bacterium]|nr:hypothetical protein [Burkholderiaceae bacterium]